MTASSKPLNAQENAALQKFLFQNKPDDYVEIFKEGMPMDEEDELNYYISKNKPTEKEVLEVCYFLLIL